MSEITFQSSLTIEEIEKNFENVDFFGGLMEGLEEAANLSTEENALEYCV